MARQGSNIISFDDAKRFASSHPASRPTASSFAASDGADGARLPRAGQERIAFAPVSAFDDLSVFESPFSRTRSASTAFGPAHPERLDVREPLRAPRPAAPRFERAPQASASRPALVAYDDGSDEHDEGREGEGRRRHSRQRRQRLKDKASRMFSEQFGADDAPGRSPSRAAVYKGEMGRSHRRAFADLEVAAPRRGASGRAGKAGKSASSAIGRIAVAAGCAVCAAAVMLFLYPTAQQVYIESREESRLQAEYDALTQRNEAMQERIDYLKTDEGIQDVARTQLGWVKEGETAVVVEGLETSDEEDSVVNIQIASGSIPAPQTWYSSVLDALFGYSGGASQASGRTADGGGNGAQASDDASAS